MLRVSFLAAILLAAASLEIVAAKDNPDPLVIAAIAAPANVSYVGVVEAVRFGSNAAAANVYRIEHRAPDLTRRDYESPVALAGDSVVSRGNLTFSLDPPRHRIIEARNVAVGYRLTHGPEYALLIKNYRITREGDDSVAGRRTVDFALINKYSGRRTMLVRIDAASKILLDRQDFNRGGTLVSEMRFEEIRYPAQVTETDFSLPKNFEVVRDPTLEETPESPDIVIASAGFAARAPREIAEGFAPVEGGFSEVRGARILHLLYSDGVRTFSLFESSTPSKLEASEAQTQLMRIGSRDAQYTEDSADGVLSWSDRNIQYTLVGEVGLVDLPHLAAAITP